MVAGVIVPAGASNNRTKVAGRSDAGCRIIAEGWRCWRAPASGCAPSAIESRPRGKYEAELLLENREQLRTVDRPRVAGRTAILDIFAIAQEAAHVGRDP